ncbi:hypothetical protein [Actinoplanes sp. NBRC 103695]|uniref:hypothetical protein n=1 Tax=Actinoplanes sp. NBRC 103695 TaxID=3032202 RepID=UPI002552B7AF|nr:hypothetical protein [Actinoplanes sp. NBRC 103695]
MADEPPREFVDFVADRLPWLNAEADRLTDGAEQSAGFAALVLSDVALHWRRLTLRTRVTHADEARAFAGRRLTMRTKQWREDQIYQVEVRVMRRQAYQAAHFPASYAARKAEVLASTVRTATAPLAEAAIAWSDARHRAFIHRVVRTTVIVIAAIAFFLSLIPSTPDY